MAQRSITQAELEVARFLARQPAPAEIVAFRLPPDVAAHFYELVDTERAGSINDAERAAFTSQRALGRRVRLVKAEAHLRLGQQAS